MMGGPASSGGQRNNNARPYSKPNNTATSDAGKTIASQKFDALFGGDTPDPTEPGASEELEQILSESLAPSDNHRKQSNADSTHSKGDNRKYSNISESSGNR